MFGGQVGAAVGAAHQVGVQRDYVHELTEAEFFTGELEAYGGLACVGKQFAGVVAGLAVDVDGAGVVGGFRLVGPEVVGEPAAVLGDKGEVAGAVVVDT